MDVNGPNPVRSSVPIQPTNGAGEIRETSQSGPLEPHDQIEISDAARMMEEIDASSELHQARLDQIKEEIRNGTYETPEKLESALWKLLNQIESEPTS